MLKVKHFGAFALGMLMLASCASDDIRPADELNESLVYIEGNSSYKIHLRGHATATVTRAAIMGDESTAVLDSMGVFALAREAQGVNEAAYDDYSWFNDERNWSFCLMDNVKATMNGGNITWDGAYFYPITLFYAYDFYGYYPYTQDVTRYDNSIVAHYTIDGTQDLIWGRATSDEDYAYSAKYYRTYGGSAQDPTLDLKHLLTRLTFTIQPGENYEGSGDYSQAETMKLKSIEICDVYTHLDVLVADRVGLEESDWSNADHIARLALRDEIKDTLFLHKNDTEAIDLTQVPSHEAEPLQVGESVMLYPEASYIIKVVLVDENGTEHVSEIPLTLSNGGQMFARGNSYKVRIIVHGPREISVKGTLTPWNELDGPTLEL